MQFRKQDRSSFSEKRNKSFAGDISREKPGPGKGEILDLRIGDFSDDGLGIGRQDGFVWFVKDTVIGDRVRAQVMKRKKNYGFARILEVTEPSPDRITPPCPVARQCGGCQIQQMSYPAQLRFKEEKVRNNLLRIGGIEEELLDRVFEPIVGMQAGTVEQPLPGFRYRNKAQYPVAGSRDGRIIAGFYAGRTHSVIECEDCLLGVPENREILRTILGWAEKYGIEPYDEVSGGGILRHILLRKGFRSGQHMACLVINAEMLPHALELTELLCGETSMQHTPGDRKEQAAGAALPCPHIDSLSFSVNTSRDNVIMGSRIVDLYGPGYIEDSIGDVRFRISPLSFYQVNPAQTEKMYSAALEFAELGGTENVWDLYCGIGTISLFLARRAKHVYGVEIVPEAIRDARKNAALNGIENAEFFTGAAEDVLPAWYAAHPEERIDVVCVDPPRKGCDEKCLETIVRMQPDRLVYVSCDSATLARDIKYLRAHGYELRRVRAIDNFGMTVHVETVCLLSKLTGAKNHISVKVDMDEMDVTAAESKATYQEIQEWVQEKYGFHVSHLNIAKTKRKCGIIERQNYNLPKNEDSRSPETPKEKEEAIIEAFKAFQMIKP